MKYDSTNHKLNKLWIDINKSVDKVTKDKNTVKRITSETKTYKNILTLLNTTLTKTSLNSILEQVIVQFTRIQVYNATDWTNRTWQF